MVENFKDEESDDDDDDDDSDEEETKEEIKTTQDFKEKMEKKCLKVDRKQSLKPFTELELFTLELTDMQNEFKGKLKDIESGNADDVTLKSYKQITRWSMNDNEFIPFDLGPKQPLEQITRTIDTKHKKGSTDVQEGSDEVFDWYSEKLDDTSYFCIINTDRRTLKKGEEAFNSYGSCTNKYWLETYGFAIEDSPYDSVVVYLQMKADKTYTIDQMVSLIPPAPSDRLTHVQKADLKSN